MTVPEGWTRNRLTDIAEVILGQSPPSSSYNADMLGLPFLQGNTEFGPEVPKVTVWTTQVTKEAHEGDVLISVRAPVGEVNIADQACCIGRGVMALSPVLTTTRFLYYSVQHEAATLKNLSQGSTFTAITGKELRGLSLLCPPLPEQKKIASILSSVDETIQATRETIEQTKRVKQGLMQKLLTRGIGHTRFKKTEIGEIPEEWEICKLGEHLEFINGRGFKPHEWKTAGLPIIRIQNLRGSTEFNYYDGDFNPKLLVTEGDLLFAWSGSRGTSFGSHVWTGPKGLLNYHTWRVVSDETFYKEYLFFALAGITQTIEKEAHGASALVHMQKREMVKYCVAVPSIDEQKEIAAILSSFDASVQSDGSNLRQLELIKKGLMQDLLTGKVRVAV